MVRISQSVSMRLLDYSTVPSAKRHKGIPQPPLCTSSSSSKRKYPDTETPPNPHGSTFIDLTTYDEVISQDVHPRKRVSFFSLSHLLFILFYHTNIVPGEATS